MTERRLRVVFDVDGVLADFTGGVARALARHNLRMPTVDRWDFFKAMPLETRERAFDLVAEPGFCATLEPLGGTFAEILAHLDRIRWIADVVIATSPWGSPTWEAERRAWLQRHLAVDPHDVLFCRRKQHVHGDVFVDDKRGNVHAWQTLHHEGQGFLWPHAHNAAPLAGEDDEHVIVPKLDPARPWEQLHEIVTLAAENHRARRSLATENAELRAEVADLRERLAKLSWTAP